MYTSMVLKKWRVAGYELKDNRWLRPDALIPLVVAVFAAFTRLWRIHEPAGVVFDEVHFGKFTSWTLKRWMYFDIHPPLAKLTYAASSLLLGYDESKCDYEPPPGQSSLYAADCEYWKLRLISAAFSVATCVLMYYCAREFGATPWGGALSSCFCIFDFLNLIEGRAVLLNTQLLFWLLLALYTAQRWWARLNQEAVSNRPMHVRERLLWCLAVGFTCGNAVSVKHTGLGTPGLVAVESAFAIFFLRKGPRTTDLLLVGMIAFLTYAGWFAVHFWNMRYSHGLFRQEEEFMTPQFQSLLIGSRNYDPLAKWTEGFWWTFFTFNKRMVDHSAAITQPHNWGTRPLEWIGDERGISYWGSTMGDPSDADSVAVYYIGNPLVVWPAAALLLASVVALIVHLRLKPYPVGYYYPFLEAWRRTFDPLAAPMCFCLAGYLVNLLPYAAVARTTFLYHYLPALVYAELLAALLVDRLTGKRGVQLFMAVLLLSWLYWWPWIYAEPITPEAHARRRWLPRWN